MLKIYGSPVSSPTNKVRYVANYLNIPYEFHRINLAAGEQKTPEFLAINPYGRIPAIDDDGFTLAESNAIIRYLANKVESDLYPRELQTRAKVDQWIDFASLHVMLSLSRIMFNTYFYKIAGTTKDERSLEEGRKFINTYLPMVEQQLNHSPFIAADALSLADITMIAALDTAELSQVDLSIYPRIVEWRKELTSETFYTQCHVNFDETFNRLLNRINA